MKTDLAVLAPWIGAPSETFIGRHMNHLFPDRTATMIGDYWSKPAWRFSGPVFHLRPSQRFFWERVFKRDVFRELKEFIHRQGVEAVLGEYLDFSLEWFSSIRGEVKTFVAHAHGFDVSARLLNPEWVRAYQVWNEADAIVVVSEYSRQNLIKAGLKKEKIHVVPCGVDIPESVSEKKSDELVRCLVTSRMVAKKAPLLILESFRRALMLNPGLRLDWVGDGPFMEEVKILITRHDLGEKVKLHGFCPHEHVLNLMKRADIFLQHSVTSPDNGDQEGLPVAILEAMAHGLPVVSTLHAGIPEAVNSATGFLVPEGDVAAMVDKICVLAADSHARGDMGMAGRRRAQEKFSWQQEQNALLELIGLKS